ncbi:hypothetical protein SAMN05518801_12632 [Novosphingobium sp. CF614]|uniref:hypothetical protein n=1 Tax=Novosphingobium sp. CF614 TaxID=1884364 RepID=UPI0008F076DE|nr:hypothetical protein [Novosphingobium sp. CF614]SFG43714.1 hypothetical protein SAMN05518801_12632 [Novosphingobium sp. CF614]
MTGEELVRLDALVRALQGQGAEALAYGVSRLFPHLSTRRCDAADVLEEPYAAIESCDLHLLDASTHCIRVTSDPVEANAILIASREAA